MANAQRSVMNIQEIAGCKFPVGFSTDAVKGGLAYEPRDGDFFIATYPKCGTTWTQQIVSLIYNKGVPLTNSAEFNLRSPFLEVFGKESAEQLQRPGAIKVHLPYNLTPYSDNAKYLYVVRNPKDTIVSFFHHVTTDPLVMFQEGTFDTFFEAFMEGKVPYGDYFDHVLGWYEHKKDPNVMFITYEEMRKDTRGNVLKIAKFMGDEWLQTLQKEPEVLDKVLKYSSVEYMKKLLNEDFLGSPENEEELYPGLRHVLRFIREHKLDTDKSFNIVRKGTVGDWKNALTAEQTARLDKRTEEKLKNTELYALWKSF